MVTSAGLAARIDPPRPGVSVDWTPVWESVAKVTAERAVAVVRVACYTADDDEAGAYVRLWNVTAGHVSLCRTFGAATVTVVLEGVLPGDLFAVAVGPILFDALAPGRVWAQASAVTFTDQAVAQTPDVYGPDAETMLWILADVTAGSPIWPSVSGLEASLHPAHTAFLADGSAIIHSSDYDDFTVARNDEADFPDGPIVWTMCLTTDWSAAGPVLPEINDWNIVTGLVGPGYVDADGWAWYDYLSDPIPNTSEFNPATAGLSGWMKGWVRLTKNTVTGVFTMHGSADGATWTALGGGTHTDNGPMGSGITFGVFSDTVVTVDEPTYYLHSLTVTGGATSLTFTEADIANAVTGYEMDDANQFAEPWALNGGTKVFQGLTGWVPAEHCPIWVDGINPLWSAGPTLANPAIVWSPAANPALMTITAGIQPTAFIPARGWVWEVRDEVIVSPPAGYGLTPYGENYGN